MKRVLARPRRRRTAQSLSVHSRMPSEQRGSIEIATLKRDVSTASGRCPEDLTSATTNRTGSATLIPEQLWPPHVAGGQLLDAHYGDDRCHAESAVSHLADRLVAIEIQHHRRRTTGGHVE